MQWASSQLRVLMQVQGDTRENKLSCTFLSIWIQNRTEDGTDRKDAPDINVFFSQTCTPVKPLFCWDMSSPATNLNKNFQAWGGGGGGGTA